MAVTRSVKRAEEASKHIDNDSPEQNNTAEQQPVKKAKRSARLSNKGSGPAWDDDQEEDTMRPAKKARRSTKPAKEVPQPGDGNENDEATMVAKQPAKNTDQEPRKHQVQPESIDEPEVRPAIDPEIDVVKEKPKKQPKPYPEFDNRKYDYDNLITVLVGVYEQPFQIHKDKICEKSKFFKAACSTRWLEGQTKVVKLPEATRVTFQTYCDWVYSGELPIKNIPASEAEDRKDEKGREQYRIIKLYLLADVLDDLKLRNKCMHRLVSHTDYYAVFPAVEMMKQIFDSTPPGSRFRKMWVDRYVARIARDGFAKNSAADMYHPDLLQGIAVAALQKLITSRGPLREWPSQYAEYLEPEVDDEKGS